MTEITAAQAALDDSRFAPLLDATEQTIRQALEKQGKQDESGSVRARFEKAWRDADVVLATARTRK